MIDSFCGTDTCYGAFVEIGISALICQQEYRFIPFFCIVTLLSCLFPSMVKWEERVNYPELYPFVASTDRKLYKKTNGFSYSARWWYLDRFQLITYKESFSCG